LSFVYKSMTREFLPLLVAKECLLIHFRRCLDSLASTTEEVQKDISKFSQIMENTAQEVSGVVTTVAQVSGAVTDMNRTVTKALQEMNISLVQTVSPLCGYTATDLMIHTDT